MTENLTKLTSEKETLIPVYEAIRFLKFRNRFRGIFRANIKYLCIFVNNYKIMVYKGAIASKKICSCALAQYIVLKRKNELVEIGVENAVKSSIVNNS